MDISYIWDSVNLTGNTESGGDEDQFKVTINSQIILCFFSFCSCR